MATRRFSRKPPTGLCAEPAQDDGVDPRLLPRRPHGSVSNRKALQLCRQVERILSVAFEGELLRDLVVRAVIPAPDSSRLLVTVVFHGADDIDTREIMDALTKDQKRLRSEVASAIHRRKTPELTFHVERACGGSCSAALQTGHQMR